MIEVTYRYRCDRCRDPFDQEVYEVKIGERLPQFSVTMCGGMVLCPKCSSRYRVKEREFLDEFAEQTQVRA